MEAAQYDELSQQLAQTTRGYTKQIKATELNEKIKSVKDFFQDQSQVLIGKQIEESLEGLKKAGGVLKSLGLKGDDVEKLAKNVGSKAKNLGQKFAEDAKTKVQNRLAGTRDEASRSVRSRIRGEEPEPEQADDIPLQNMASGDVGSGAEANPLAQDGNVAQNAESEAQTTQESISRGGGSVLGEDKPIAGSVQEASQEQAQLQSTAETIVKPDSGDDAQPGAKAQNERNKDKEEDEDGDGESKFERDIKEATRDTEKEDAVDPGAEEASLPLTAILGGISLIASMFTKDHHKAVIQKAQAATSSAVQVGI